MTKISRDRSIPPAESSGDSSANLLAEAPYHPQISPTRQKFNESEDLWQARVTKSWRFYFKIDDDTYIIARIVPHPKK